MRFDGIECQRARHIGFRDSKPGDVDTYGEQIRKYYCVFVYIKKCRIYEENGKKYYDSSEAPNIPACNGASNYAYGKTRKRKQFKYFWVDYEKRKVCVPVWEYYTTPYYVAYDGMVYRGSITHTTPNYSYYKQQEMSHDEITRADNKAEDEFNLYVKKYVEKE